MVRLLDKRLAGGLNRYDRRFCTVQIGAVEGSVESRDPVGFHRIRWLLGTGWEARAGRMKIMI